MVGRGSGRWREDSVREDHNKALLFTFIQFLWEIFLRMFELHCEIELVEMIVTFLNLHVLISYFYFNVE